MVNETDGDAVENRTPSRTCCEWPMSKVRDHRARAAVLSDSRLFNELVVQLALYWTMS